MWVAFALQIRNFNVVLANKTEPWYLSLLKLWKSNKKYHLFITYQFCQHYTIFILNMRLRKPAFWYSHPSKTRLSLCICTVWSVLAVCIKKPLYPWLSKCTQWRCPTGDQEVAGSTPAEVGNILSWRLIMKYFLWSFSPFRWFKKGSCQFLAKECAQYWLTA